MTLNDPDQAQGVWKAQKVETPSARIKARPEQLESLVRSRENLNKFVYWTATGVTALLAAGFLYNVVSAIQPWIRFGQAWALAFLAFVLATQLPYRPSKKGAQETCARFLERQHQERAQGYLRLRRRLWLLIPSIVASWIGRGALMAAKTNGFDPSSWLFRFCAGPWPFILIMAVLALIWLAFGAAAGKARRDAEEIRIAIAGNA
jgi:hypothetical protein